MTGRIRSICRGIAELGRTPIEIRLDEKCRNYMWTVLRVSALVILFGFGVPLVFNGLNLTRNANGNTDTQGLMLFAVGAAMVGAGIGVWLRVKLVTQITLTVAAPAVAIGMLFCLFWLAISVLVFLKQLGFDVPV